MLRAIGAQIEKTTNREACRDLSGRRLRDINEEKRLKTWIDNQAKRDEEAVARKKRKLEKLRAQPKHEFKDKTYEEQRSNLTERVENAVEAGFAAAAAAASTSIKREAERNSRTNLKKKRKTFLDDDIDSDELESSDESADEKESVKKQTVEAEKSDPENSLDAASNCPSSSSAESADEKESLKKQTVEDGKSGTEDSLDAASNCPGSSNEEEKCGTASRLPKSNDDSSR